MSYAGPYVEANGSRKAGRIMASASADFAGAYGGLFSSTVIVVMLIIEVARPGGQRLCRARPGRQGLSSHHPVLGSVRGRLDSGRLPRGRLRTRAARTAARRDVHPWSSQKPPAPYLYLPYTQVHHPAYPGAYPADPPTRHQVDWFTTLLLAAGADVPGDRMIDGMEPERGGVETPPDQCAAP